MKAAVRDRYGPPDVVRIEDIEQPVPVDDQVLVRVVAASVNRADLDNIYPKPQFVRLFTGLRAPRWSTGSSALRSYTIRHWWHFENPSWPLPASDQPNRRGLPPPA